MTTESSLSVTLSNAFNKTGNAFALHDNSKFETTLQQSTASMNSNPFNDSMATFGELNINQYATNFVTPKNETEFRDALAQNNTNFSAMFSSFDAVSNKYEAIKDTDKLKNNDMNNDKNLFGKEIKEKNAWNELNAFDFSRLQSEFSGMDNQSSIFTNLNQDQASNKMQSKKEIPPDFFDDVATAAFSEFNSARHKNNEFFNKITGFDCVRT